MTMYKAKAELILDGKAPARLAITAHRTEQLANGAHATFGEDFTPATDPKIKEALQEQLKAVLKAALPILDHLGTLAAAEITIAELRKGGKELPEFFAGRKLRSVGVKGELKQDGELTAG